MDKTQILERLKEACKLKNNKQLAQFLNVSPSTVTNWYNRNSIDFDLIFSKCDDIDLNWLVFGKDKIDPALIESQLISIQEAKAEYERTNNTMTLELKAKNEQIRIRDEHISRLIFIIEDLLKSYTIENTDLK